MEPAALNLPPDADATLVETGGFRVDRGRALDRIRSYRRGDVGCVWLFLRAASTAGAGEAAVRRQPDGFSVEFGGRHFKERVLRDPYASLFGEGGGDDAERWLALGLLHAFGPGLRLVTVESGPKDERRRLSARDVGQEVVAPVPGEGAMTVVRVKTDGAFERHWRHPLPESDQAAAPRCLVWGRMRADVDRGYDSFTAVPPAAEGPGEWGWEEGPVLGRLWVPEPGREGVDVYVAGVYAARVVLPGRIAVTGKIDHPGLALDASLAALVRNEGLRDVLDKAQGEAGRLVEKTAAGQAVDMKGLAPLLSSDRTLADFWRSCLEDPRGDEALADAYMRDPGPVRPVSRSEAVREVRAAARRTVWLREVCSRTRADDPWAQALEDCPLALRDDFTPVPLRELRGPLARTLRDGVVPEFWMTAMGSGDGA